MNIFGNIILLFGLFPSFGHQAAVIQEPSPAVVAEMWGYILPQYDTSIRNVHTRLFRRDNGDVLITYVTEPINTLKADGSCCDDDFMRAGVEFFSGKTYTFGPAEYEEFYRDVSTTQYMRNTKILLKDNSTVEVVSNAYNCYQFLNAALVKKDRNGRVVASKVLFYKLDKPKSILVDESCGSNAPRSRIDIEVENIDPLLVKLDENNFLIYEPANGNVVVRFNADLQTQFSAKNFILMDQADVETLRQRLGMNKRYNEQAFHDLLVSERLNPVTRLSQSRVW